MFVDEAEIELTAGHGGPGKVSFYKVRQKGPDGGNGGKGGDIYFAASDSVTTLGYFLNHKKIFAQNGEAGMSNKKYGKNAQDTVLSVPLQTEIADLETGEKFFLEKPGETILICQGGLGGRGNFEFRSSRNTTPEYAQPGLEGQKRRISLHIKLIADVGLIGLPNSGKSSLLNELTSANVKVGNYAFTTLEPNLGVLQVSHKKRKIIADIPGIIEGASTGKGLGLKFLKHIEKVKILLHCIPCDSEDPLSDYHTVSKELADFNPSLKRKKEVIVLTKSDLASEEGIDALKTELGKLGKDIVAVSVYNLESIDNLKGLL
jgi:GTPase